MDNIHNATTALNELEQRFRKLIQDAVSVSAFDDAKRLVDAVAALGQVRNVLGSGHKANESVPINPTFNATAREAARDHQRPKPSEFPRFEKDGDRLTKVGWSSKDKSTYEHRVTRDVAFDVAQFLGERVKGKRPFKMEKMFPILARDGNEVPGYQAYLVLKWLQHFGVVERKGNDGYLIREHGLSTESIEEVWRRTPQRS